MVYSKTNPETKPLKPRGTKTAAEAQGFPGKRLLNILGGIGLCVAAAAACGVAGRGLRWPGPLMELTAPAGLSWPLGSATGQPEPACLGMCQAMCLGKRRLGGGPPEQGCVGACLNANCPPMPTASATGPVVSTCPGKSCKQLGQLCESGDGYICVDRLVATLLENVVPTMKRNVAGAALDTAAMPDTYGTARTTSMENLDGHWVDRKRIAPPGFSPADVVGSCRTWDCDTVGQYCAPGLPGGGYGYGYVCGDTGEGLKWREGNAKTAEHGRERAYDSCPKIGAWSPEFTKPGFGPIGRCCILKVIDDDFFSSNTELVWVFYDNIDKCKQKHDAVAPWGGGMVN